MECIDQYLLDDPKYYIDSLNNNDDYELLEYQPPDDKSGRGNKMILKIIKKEDKDIIVYSYENYD